MPDRSGEVCVLVLWGIDAPDWSHGSASVRIWSWISQWKMLRVKHLCSLYSLRYVKRCNRRWIDSVDPHKNRSTDLNFCCLVCLLQWRTLFQHTYLVKMCYILLIFVAKFQKFFWGPGGCTPPLRAPPYSFPPEHFYFPRSLGSRWNTVT